MFEGEKCLVYGDYIYFFTDNLFLEAGESLQLPADDLDINNLPESSYWAYLSQKYDIGKGELVWHEEGGLCVAMEDIGFEPIMRVAFVQDDEEELVNSDCIYSIIDEKDY